MEHSDWIKIAKAVEKDNSRYRRISKADWAIKLDNISSVYSLIGDDILLYETDGNLKEHHMKKLFNNYEFVLEDSGIAQNSAER